MVRSRSTSTTPSGLLLGVEQRRGGRVDDQLAAESLRDAELAPGGAAAGLEHGARERPDRVARAQQLVQRLAERGLGRGAEDAAGLRVRELDAAGVVQHDDAIEHGIEHALRIARHG